MTNGLRMAALGAMLVGMLVGGSPAAQMEQAPRFGRFHATIEGLAAPEAVAFDASGRLLIAEADAGRVRRMHWPSGETIDSFNGPLARPVALALCEQQRLYVSDLDRDRIEVFSPEGTHLFGFGGRGEGPGLLRGPRGVVVARDRIWVADAGNARIALFDLSGAPAEPPAGVTLPGDLRRPVGVAVHGRHLIITDADAHRIHGVPLDPEADAFSFGERGPFAGLMDEPAAAVSPGDRLLVLERFNHRVQAFVRDESGIHRGAETFGMHALLPREGEGRLHYPTGLAVFVGDEHAIAAIAEPVEDRVQLFRPLAPGEPAHDEPWDPEMLPRTAHFGQRFALSGSLLAAPETEAHVVRLFDVRGRVPILIGEFGERGTGSGRYDRPSAVAFVIASQEGAQGSRTLLVADESAGRIDRLQVHFDPDGSRGFSPRRLRLVGSISAQREAEAPREAGAPHAALHAMTHLPEGRLVALDARRREVLLMRDDQRLEHFPGTDGSTFVRPVDLSVTRDGDLLVVDAGARAVVRLDREGRERTRYAADEHLRQPFGAAEGPDGAIYVSDASRSAIVVFQPDGTFERSFGVRGEEPGQIWKPAGLAFDEEGRLFVLDDGNHRIQIFAPDGTWLVSFGTGRAFVRREGGP